MNKYKVGDEVMIIGKIRQTDDDDQLPYLVSIGEHGYWVREHDIAGLASDFERGQPEPKFKVGDKVIWIKRPDFGVGTVVSANDNEHEVKFYLLGFPLTGFKDTDLTPAGVP